MKTPLMNSWLVQLLSPSLPRRSGALSALRDGMLWLVPCLILSNILIFASSLLDFFSLDEPLLMEGLHQLNGWLTSLYPYFFAASISMMLAIYWRLPRPPIAILNMAYIAVTAQILGHEGQAEATLLLFVGLTMPLYSVPLLSKLESMPFARILETELAGKPVKDSMNLMLPGALVAAVVAVVAFALNALFNYFEFDILLNAFHGMDVENNPIESGCTFAALNSMFWFVGIHGYYALTPMVEPLITALDINRTAVLAGGHAPNVMSLSTLSLFVFVGGAGATLGLSIALIAFSKSKMMRVIAITSIPLGLFNINELLLFGLPIIFNPRLFLPFLFTPLVNVVVTVLVLQMGLVAVPYTLAPMNSPIIINAYVATGGDISAIALQLFIIALNVLIYLPFVRRIDNQAKQQEVYIPSLDTTFTRSEEEAYVLSVDPVREALLRSKEMEDTHKSMALFSNREFYLEYQPQINSITQKVVGMEALIRVRDQRGNVELPAEFLHIFEKANMMSDIDVWVVKNSVAQCEAWIHEGLEIPISVNITSPTLTNAQKVGDILLLIERVPGLIHFEITEDTLIQNEIMVGDSIRRLHEAGARVHIDDFGTGYSSLSYLNRFDIDALKIDQSFVAALSNEKGQKVFNGLIAIANELDIKIIVEGVETKEQYAYVSQKADVEVQGWYFSRAIAANDFASFNIQHTATMNANI
ncbi:EAL domain-containing protein [Enterovibrio norvegicus]|uniref:EAL domain-containing protein n=1 Tax=Enterovibrio norvegicus TaxID=188144 RepID=UPI0024B1077B|nr:EAL domain-containing protein [Enterovibrio norvegicus]